MPKPTADQEIDPSALALFDQVKANFYNPRLIGSILASPPKTEEHGEQAGHALRPA